MDSRTGKTIRLGRLFRPETGKSIVVAFSHGVLLGPIDGMRTAEEMCRTALSLSAADGIMIAPGMVRRLESAFVGRGRPSLVVHLDWSSFSRTILPYEQGAQASLAGIEEIAAAGADAVMTYLLLGHDDPAREAEEIARNASVARACERLGIVHIVEPRHSLERREPDRKLDPHIMRLYCRISAEIGADVVKCIWPGSSEILATIVEGTPAPVLLAGGARQDEFEAALRRAEEAIASGCRGLVFGRNIYQAPDPAAALAALVRVVHGR